MTGAPSPLPRLLPMAAAFLGGAALAAIGAAIPPFHLLTHEFSQGFAVVAGIATLFAARRGAGRMAARRTLGEHGVDTLVARGVILAWTLGLGAFLAHLATDVPLRGCRTAPGAVFFWITWLPLSALAVVAGTASGLGGGPRRRFLVIAATVWGLGIAHAALQGLTGRRIMEPFLGAPLLFDQRADLVPDVTMLLERAWLGLVALTAWAVLRRARGGSSAFAWATGALLAGVTLLGPSWLGLGFGRGATWATLDGVRTTEHFEIHYATGGTAALYVDNIAREAEWQFHLLSPDFPGADRRITLLVAEGPEELFQLTGISAPHAWYGGFAVAWWAGLNSTLRHELVHVLHGLAHPNPLVTLDRATTEGTASAWEDDLVTLPAAHAVAAAALARGDLPAVRALLSPVSFWTLDETAAYEASGSLMGFLVQRYGVEAFGVWLDTASLARAFGATADEIDAAWRAFLATVPVDADATRRARTLFDATRSPPYTATACPKVGPLTPRPLDLAADQWARTDLRAAALTYEGLFASSADPDYAAWAAQARLLDGDTGAALTLVERARASGGEGPDVDVADRLATTELAALLLGGRVDDALSRISAGPASPTRAAVGRLLADPATAPSRAPALARLLVSDEGPVRDAALASLRAAAPDDPDLRLLTLVADPSLSGPVRPLGVTFAERDALRSALASLAALPDACPDVAAGLASAGRHAASIGELELALEVATALDGCPVVPRAHLDAERLRERVTWEKTRGNE